MTSESERDLGGDAARPDIWVAHQRRPSLARRASRFVRDRLRSAIDALVLPEDDAPRDPLARIFSLTPPWLVSMVIHLSLMIALGLIVLKSHTKEESISVEMAAADDEPLGEDEIYAETLGEQLETPTAMPSNEGSADETTALGPSDLPAVSDPLASLPHFDITPQGSIPTADLPTTAIGLAFTGREEGTKQALLKAYGGTALTEDAVAEGLRWLSRQQKRGGLWSLKGPYQDGTTSENTEVATAMALLAFQGAGYTPMASKNDAFHRVVARGWRGLLRSQHEDGHFFGNLIPQQQQLYTQAMATIALCELFGMTRDESYRDPAQRAIDYCVRVQSPEGGWRYQPGVDSDLSVTGWFAMALQSGRMAGLEVPSPALDRLSEFLDLVQREDGSQYAYTPTDGATVTLSAEGLLCRQYLGWQHDDPRLRAGVAHFLTHLPEWDKRNVYYWYYATQVCHHMEGNDWQRWNNVMRQLLPENQVKRGPERGSWDPAGDRWGPGGGRLYVTCLSLYTLEVYYRHLPIYRKDMLTD
jgi:hypothetical protein